MRVFSGRWLGVVVAFGGLCSTALAQEPRVEVMAEVVAAGTQGNVIDPPTLKAMQDKLAPKKRYSTLRRLSLEKVLVGKAVSSVKLPNAKVATLKLVELKEGVAKLEVSVPPLSTVYTLGRQGSLYQAAGAHEGSDLWLVLSAVEKAKPRRFAHPR